MDKDSDEDNEGTKTPPSDFNKKLKYFMLMGCGTKDGCHHFQTGKWIIKFYNDNETTEVNFPNEEVRLVN